MAHGQRHRGFYSCYLERCILKGMCRERTLNSCGQPKWFRSLHITINSKGCDGARRHDGCSLSPTCKSVIRDWDFASIPLLSLGWVLLNIICYRCTLFPPFPFIYSAFLASGLFRVHALTMVHSCGSQAGASREAFIDFRIQAMLWLHGEPLI